MTPIKIQKKCLEVLFKVLKETEGKLSLAQARTRDLFLKHVTPALESFYADRRKIYDTFCVKKEDGTPDIKDNQYRFEKEEAEKMSKEMDVFMAEEVELQVPFADVVKKIIEGTEYKPLQGEAELIDEVLAKI